MAGRGRIRASMARALLCAALAASLCAPRLWTATPGLEREPCVQILALGTASPAVQANRANPRLDQARQRTSAGSPFVPVPACLPARDGGHFARSVEDARPRSRFASKVLSGRAPPLAIS